MPKSAETAHAVAKIERSAALSPGATGLTGRIYALMALTTFTTFATLVTIHQLFFTHSVFA